MLYSGLEKEKMGEDIFLALIQTYLIHFFLLFCIQSVWSQKGECHVKKLLTCLIPCVYI